jgi:hypothetical protein
MTAKEMFEKIGYSVCNKDKESITYCNNNCGTYDIEEIQIYKDGDVCYTRYTDYDKDIVETIVSVKETLAVVQQLKEFKVI